MMAFVSSTSGNQWTPCTCSDTDGLTNRGEPNLWHTTPDGKHQTQAALFADVEEIPLSITEVQINNTNTVGDQG